MSPPLTVGRFFGLPAAAAALAAGGGFEGTVFFLELSLTFFFSGAAGGASSVLRPPVDPEMPFRIASISSSSSVLAPPPPSVPIGENAPPVGPAGGPADFPTCGFGFGCLGASGGRAVGGSSSPSLWMVADPEMPLRMASISSSSSVFGAPPPPRALPIS